MKWIAIVVWLVCVGTVRAEEEDEEPVRYDQLELRVTAHESGGRVLVDRGSSDGLVEGDAVVFRHKERGPVWANVVEVRERTCVVEFLDPNFLPPPGTRGRARIPQSRRPAPPKQAPEGTPVPKVGEHPPWQNEDEGYVEGQPLLSRVDSVRPEKRPWAVSGRVWTAFDVIVGTQDRTDGFYRGGVDARAENPFGLGGQLHFDGEINHRHALDDNGNDEDVTLSRLDRFSYTYGGTRYRRDRFQGGRFLQRGMPEFGELDGVEWSHRFANGHRVGSSMGWMPEPDKDHTTGRDFQIAGWYEWVANELEELAFAAGYQRTWHGGAPDRDLLVARMHWLPLQGWNASATAFLDLYSAGDDEKSGIGLTHLNAVVRRQFKNAGIDFAFAHQEFPDIERNEFVFDEGLTGLPDDRLNRLSANGWTRMGRKLRLRGHVAGWVDEDDAGSDGEVALAVDDPLLLFDDDRIELAVFGNVGQHTKSHGARGTYGQTYDAARWDLMYEIADHRFNGFNADNDDLLQHRVRASGELWTLSGWTFSLYAEARLWSDEGAGLVGAFLQRSF